MSQGTAIFLAIICVIANGFFVAAEFAIVKVRETQVGELLQQGARGAKLLRSVLDNLEAYLSACQLGITLSSLGLGWLGEPAVASALEPLFELLGVENQTVLHTVSFAVAFSLISFLHIVVGEQAPKSMAVRRPVSWALVVIYPLRFFYVLMFPFIQLLNASSNGLLRLLRMHGDGAHEHAVSEEELQMMVASSHESGVLEEHEREMLENVFEFADHTVHEIMVPRTKMVCLYADRPFEANLAVIRETMHTRYPLVRGDRDHVIGMVHLKDLYFAIQDSGVNAPELETVRRDLVAVPDTMSASDLLALFRRRRVHMALAIDEYGGTSGLITFEDLIEELVGEIEDEFDEQEDPIHEEAPDTWLVDGNLPLRDLSKATGLDLEEEDVDSVGGLLMLRLNRIPRQGEHVEVQGLDLEIVKMQRFRVGRVRVTRQLASPDVP